MNVTLTTTEETCSIRFEHRSDYLYATIESFDADIEARRDLWRKIAAEYKTKRYNRLLVVEKARETLSTADVFELASEIPTMGFGNGRSAYVDRDLENADIVKFGETVAINRGMNCAVFNSVEEAEAWLLK